MPPLLSERPMANPENTQEYVFPGQDCEVGRVKRHARGKAVGRLLMFIILCIHHHTWHTVGPQHVLHEQMQECINERLCVKYYCFNLYHSSRDKRTWQGLVLKPQGAQCLKRGERHHRK